MDLSSLRNRIETEGGVLNTLDQGYRDEDIDDEEMSEMWYELQVQFDNLTADIAEFEDRLGERLLEELN
jgi:hypothetical protein